MQDMNNQVSLPLFYCMYCVSFFLESMSNFFIFQAIGPTGLFHKEGGVVKQHN